MFRIRILLSAFLCELSAGPSNAASWGVPKPTPASLVPLQWRELTAIDPAVAKYKAYLTNGDMVMFNEAQYGRNPVISEVAMTDGTMFVKFEFGRNEALYQLGIFFPSVTSYLKIKNGVVITSTTDEASLQNQEAQAIPWDSIIPTKSISDIANIIAGTQLPVINFAAEQYASSPTAVRVYEDPNPWRKEYKVIRYEFPCISSNNNLPKVVFSYFKHYYDQTKSGGISETKYIAVDAKFLELSSIGLSTAPARILLEATNTGLPNSTWQELGTPEDVSKCKIILGNSGITFQTGQYHQSPSKIFVKSVESWYLFDYNDIYLQFDFKRVEGADPLLPEVASSYIKQTARGDRTSSTEESVLPDYIYSGCCRVKTNKWLEEDISHTILPKLGSVYIKYDETTYNEVPSAVYRHENVKSGFRIQFSRRQGYGYIFSYVKVVQDGGNITVVQLGATEKVVIL